MTSMQVGLVLPLPPFNSVVGDQGARSGGLDVELISAIAEKLGTPVEFVPAPVGFADICAGLDAGRYDCALGGITVTPQRARLADFTAPSLISGLALAVDTARLPHVRSVRELAGLRIAMLLGATGGGLIDDLADQAQVQGYDDGAAAAAALRSGRCDAVVALAPVLTELVKPLPDVEVVQRGLSREPIAIAVAGGDAGLLHRIGAAQDELDADGTLQRIRRRWLGNPYRDHSLVIH
jgi:ABC-type amino acid transport substrate-binding protein